MSDEHEVEACPECNASNIYHRMATDDYRCLECECEFDEPAVRGPRRGTRPTTAELLDRVQGGDDGD